MSYVEHPSGTGDVLSSCSLHLLGRQERVVVPAGAVANLITDVPFALVLAIAHTVFCQSVEDVALVFAILTLEPLLDMSAHFTLNLRVGVDEVRVMESLERYTGNRMVSLLGAILERPVGLPSEATASGLMLVSSQAFTIDLTVCSTII